MTPPKHAHKAVVARRPLEREPSVLMAAAAATQLYARFVRRHAMTQGTNRWLVGWLVACWLVIGPCPLQGQLDSAHIRRVLERRYAQQDSAIAQRDLAGFLSTLAPQYVVQLRDGRVFTRPGIDSAIGRDMHHTRAVRMAATAIEALRLRGDTVWVTVVHRTDRILADERGQPHRWENGVRHEEEWLCKESDCNIAVLREGAQLYRRRDGSPLE